MHEAGYLQSYDHEHYSTGSVQNVPELDLQYENKSHNRTVKKMTQLATFANFTLLVGGLYFVSVVRETSRCGHMFTEHVSF
jgi:hypothetical protein